MSWRELTVQYDKSHQNQWNRLCHMIGIPVIIVGFGIVLAGHSSLGWGLFALGWVFQILGHLIEGTKPEFLSNPTFLLVGPIYFVEKFLRRLK